MFVCLHELIQYVIEQHQCISPNSWRGGAWGNLEGVVDVHVEDVITCAVDIRHSLVVVLHVGKLRSDFECLLLSVGDDHHAMDIVDGREFWDE